MGDEGFKVDANGGIMKDNGSRVWYSSGFHLHFNIRYEEESLNAYKWLSSENIDVETRRWNIDHYDYLQWEDSLGDLTVSDQYIILDRTTDEQYGLFYAILEDGSKEEVIWDSLLNKWKHKNNGTIWSSSTRSFN